MASFFVSIVVRYKSRTMALRVLMIGNDYDYLRIDSEMLRQRGFRVYLCINDEVVDDMVGEVKPDVVFINSKVPGTESTDIYNKLTDNVLYASLPVIFTLFEDDVYLVNRKRTAIREQRYTMSDNVIDAIKMALTPTGSSAPKRMRFKIPHYNDTRNSHRA